MMRMRDLEESVGEEDLQNEPEEQKTKKEIKSEEEEEGKLEQGEFLALDNASIVLD